MIKSISYGTYHKRCFFLLFLLSVFIGIVQSKMVFSLLFHSSFLFFLIFSLKKGEKKKPISIITAKTIR